MNILHPTDFSQTASHALAFARTLQEVTAGTLHVVHVQENYELPDGLRIPKTDRRYQQFEDHLQSLRDQDV